MTDDIAMRTTSVLAAILLSAVAFSDVAGADGTDEDAAQASVDQFYAATKKGDAAAMTALLEPDARKAAKRDREKPEPWPEGSTWTTLHRHVEGDWGLFWVKIDVPPEKEKKTSADSLDAEIAELGRMHSQTTPVLLHRVDGAWCFVYSGFAFAEIDLIFHRAPGPAPKWLYRDYLDWTVDSWRKTPGVRTIELDKPAGPIDIAPGNNAVFIIDLTRVVRLRVSATSDTDVAPSVSIESPAGGSYGSHGKNRRTVATCQATSGPILLLVGAEKAGMVTVEATAAADPVRLELGTASGPFRLQPADEPEFRVSLQESTDVAFAAIPLGGSPSGAKFGVTTVTARTEIGNGGLSTVATAKGPTVFRLRYDGDSDIDLLVAAVATKGAPEVAADHPAEVDVAPGKPRFLRLAASDADANFDLTGALDDAGAAFVRFAAGEGDNRTIGICVYARSATHVRVAIRPR